MFSALPLPARIASTVTTSLFTLVLAAALAPSLKAQDDPGKPPAYVDDWTHHRLVYSNPGTREEAERKGRLDQWLKITGDTRFQLQQFKRSGGPRQVGGHLGDGGGLGLGWNHGGGGGRTPYKKFTDLMEKDWSTPLGSGVGASLTTGTVGTLNGTSITGGSILTVDGVAFHASAPTSASQTGTFTGTPAAAQTVTIVGTGGTVTLTDSLSTAATQTGTFASSPLTGNAITIKNGGNTLSLTNNGTGSHATGTFSGIPSAATTISVNTGTNTLSLSTNATAGSAIGTVSGSPTSTTVPTITITNGVNGNTLNLTTNATGTHATGTFSSTGPTATQTITITNGLNSNALVLTAGNGGTGTITITGRVSTNDTLTVGTQGYSFSSNCGFTSFCINRPNGITNLQLAENIAAAITAASGSCGTAAPCYGNGTTAIANLAASAATGSGGSGVVTVTNYTGATVTLSQTNTDGLISVSGNIAAGTANSCTSAIAGTFVINPTSFTGVASNVNTAINACNTTYPAVGVTSSVAGGVVTITDTTLGAYPTLTLAKTASNFVWSGVTAGGAGSNGCTSATAGTFATGSSAGTATSDIASNLNAAITSCIGTYTAIGVTSAYSTGSTFTITSGTPGPFLTVGGSNLGTLFSWGTVTGGSAGSNTCGSSTSGTFATSASNNTLASNLAAAITACPAGAGVSATQGTGGNSNTVTVTDTTPGSFTTFTPGATNNTGIFSWGGTTTGGNGTQTCPSSTAGTYVTAATTTALATNLTAAINACDLAHATVGVTATSSGSSVTISATTWGSAANADAVTPTTGFFAWNGGNLTGGANGTTSATSFAIDNVNADDATALATAIGDNSATLGVTAASGAGTVTLTASTPGTTGNSVTLASTLGNFTWTGAALANGTDGATSGTAAPPTFAYWSGSNYVSSAQVASNIATAVNARPSFNGVLSAVANGAGITFTAAPGAAGNSYTVTASGFSAYTGTGTFGGGATATVQPNASPAKYGPSLTTASCTADFVVYPTGQPGSATAASIIAYSNIYSSCGGNVPTTYWAFNTESGANTGYTVTTSPTLSYDGTKIAFVQSNGTASELVVLKWIGASGTLTEPTAPTISADIATCTAPCMTVTPLTNNDTYSSPYYAYYSVDDSILVGDDSGSLEEFNNVFSGAISGPQTINLGNTYPLASPVYDLVSGCVFVGDTRGYLYSVNSGTPGTVCTATSFSTRGHTELLSDGGAGGGIYDAPLVDSASGAVYAFVASSAASTTTVTANEGFHSTTLAGTGGAGGTFTTAEDGKAISGTNIPTGDTITATGVNTGTNRATLTTAANCFGGTCGPYTFTITIANGGFNSVDQFATGTIGAGSTTAVPVATQEVGTGGDGYPLFAGTLDNVYYGSTNEASPSGNLYVVGNTGVTTGATLYRLPITTGTLGTPSTAVTGLTPSGAGDYPWPSPLTEFCNGACTVAGGATTGGTDYIFFSVNQGNVPGLCTGGAGNTCIESYSVNSPATILIQGAQSYANPTTNGCWGTGGIVIDNDDTSTTGASEIYFISLAGATAGGGAGGGTATSTNCTTGGAPTINAIQAQQQNP